VRNVRLGRSDRRGAWRLALFVFAGFALLWLLGGFGDPLVGRDLLIGGVFFAICSITVLVRFGVLPFLIGLFLRRVAMELPLTLDGGAWYFGATGLAFTVILGLTLYGLWIALRGRASVDDEFAEG